jgi:hypothetical protein
MQNCIVIGKFCIKTFAKQVACQNGMRYDEKCAFRLVFSCVWRHAVKDSAGKSMRDRELRGLLACGEWMEGFFGIFVADGSVGDSGGPADARFGSAVGRHTRFQSGGSEHSVF